MTKQIIKQPVDKIKKEAFIDDEHVRVKDLTHGIERYSDKVLDANNYFLEGDVTGMVGPERSVPEALVNSELLNTRINNNREKYNLTNLHHRYRQAQDGHVSKNQVHDHCVMTL